MTESQIYCFEAVAQFRSFSKAASNLMVSQPAISHQIAKLEQEMDLLLFDRTGREINLTEAGTMMYEFFSKTRADYAEILKAAHVKQRVYSGQVLLGCPEGWDISPFLPSMVNSFQEKYPNVHVELIGLPLGELEDALNDGKINVAVTMRYALKNKNKLSIHPLITVSSVVLYSKQFRFPEKKIESLADFKDCVFYLAAGNNTPAFRQSVIQECAKYDFVPQMVNCPSLSTALFYVQNNQGVLLGSELMIAKQVDYLYSYLVLDDTQCPVVLAWKPVDADASPMHLFLNEVLYNKNICSAKQE